MSIQLIHGNCLEEMKSIPDGSVDLTVTSPPYDNLRDYGEDFKGWGPHIWKPCIENLYRVTKIGGVVVWVVGDATVNGSETGTSFKQALYAMDCGFNLHDTMIYAKPGFSAVGTLIVRYASVFEYMFVFSECNLKTFNPIKDRVCNSFGSIKRGTIRQSDGSMKRMSNEGSIQPEFGQRYNIWNINPQSLRSIHPAPFPEKLANDHIISWSNEGDTVLGLLYG